LFFTVGLNQSAIYYLIKGLDQNMRLTQKPEFCKGVDIGLSKKQDINNQDRQGGLALPDHFAAGHGCRSWWLKHPSGPATPEWSGCHCHVVTDELQNCAERYVH
jgi:hypothetical protein